MKVIFLLILILISGCASTGNVANQNDVRPDYGINDSIFSNIPEFPKDFYYIDSQFSINNYTITEIKEEYYKQPEFYPTWENQGAKLFVGHPSGRIAIWGVGLYPAEQTIEIKENSEAKTVFFVHSSWLVQTYQGMQVETVYEKNYFDVFLDQEVFLLGPNYPIFDPEWVKRIEITIRPKEITPARDYLIGINIIGPPAEKSGEWRTDFKGRYVDASASSPQGFYAKILVKIK